MVLDERPWITRSIYHRLLLICRRSQRHLLDIYVGVLFVVHRLTFARNAKTRAQRVRISEVVYAYLWPALYQPTNKQDGRAVLDTCKGARDSFFQ